MRFRTVTAASLLGIVFSIGAAAQNASSVISAASTAMGANNLNSITYSGTARNGAFGQSKSIGDPHGTGERDADHGIHTYDQLSNADRPGGPRVASDRTDATAHSPRLAGTDARSPQPEHHRTTGQHQLWAGAQYPDDALGFFEGGCGRW